MNLKIGIVAIDLPVNLSIFERRLRSIPVEPILQYKSLDRVDPSQ